MKIIFIIAICLLVVACIIVILGALTHWTFNCNKKDNYSEQKLRVGPDGHIHQEYNGLGQLYNTVGISYTSDSFVLRKHY